MLVVVADNQCMIKAIEAGRKVNFTIILILGALNNIFWRYSRLALSKQMYNTKYMSSQARVL